jgi:hypothetical protein
MVVSRPGRAPRLVPDRFSLFAFLFGPFWLAWKAAWLPAALVLAAEILAHIVVAGPAGSVAGLAIGVLCGLFGREWLVISLRRRGWAMEAVVVARGRDAALRRLLDARPDLHQTLLV